MKLADEAVNIGEAARRAGVTPKMVRHYEALGLLPRVARTEAGYRVYTPAEVHTLRFIRRSRDLGFPIAEIAELLELWQDRRRSSASVKRLAQRHVLALERKLEELAAMRDTLRHLIDCCHGDDRPDCPILDDLERPEPPAAGTATKGRGPERAGRKAA